jgi:S-DNA-T family DNA segregation ATPase FtsK/SpoIIIE
VTGAFLADVFYALVGSAAYLVPLLLAYRAISLLFTEDQHQAVDWQMMGLRTLGLLLLVVSATALLSLNDGGLSRLPQGAGGILGAAIGEGFDQAFNPVGARLVLVSLFLLGLTVFADISWLGVVDWLGSKTLSGGQQVRQRFVEKMDQLRDRRAREKQLEERKLQIEQHVAKEKKRAPPKIKAPKPVAVTGTKVEQEKQKPLFDIPVVR